MAKVYKDKPEKGPLQKELELVIPEERGREKARRFRMLKPDNNDYMEFNRDEIDFSITGFRFDQAHGYFECQVSASKDGEELPLNNPYRFVNPPVLVPDGTWRKEEDEAGEESDVMNMKEDLQEALEIIVCDAVVAVAKERGWQP